MTCVIPRVRAAENISPEKTTLVYVGTYTDTPAKSKGIYVFRLRTEGATGKLDPIGVAAETPNPSFLAIDAERHRLFCANEVASFEGKPTGAVSAFSIDPMTGKLTFLNERASMGTGPCQITLDKTGKNLFVANYNSGSAAVLPIGADGRLGDASSVVQHSGKGPNAARQEGPHAHCVTLSPDNHFAFVCDLGIDKVMIYKFDAEHGKLTANDPAFATLKPGSGPRHLVFASNGKFAYVISELVSTITTFSYDANKGALTELQTVSCLPKTFKDFNKAAEIAIAPSGRFLFASNRGHDSVATFAIDPEKGTLRWVSDQSCGGKTPRQFAIAPSGGHVVICNQDSNLVVVDGIDAATGQLEPSGSTTVVPSPSCAVFYPLGGR